MLGRWLDVLATPARALRAARLLRRGGFVKLQIDGPLVEIDEARPWWSPRRRRATSIGRIRELVDRVAGDKKVDGLLVEIRSLHAGAATATSLRRALLKLRGSEKKLVVYLPHGAGSREMLVAAAADRIIVAPQGTLLPLGVAVETHYFRRALDRLGVQPEIFARGEFKTAGEALQRDSMSDAQREQIGAVLDTLHGELVTALTEGRGAPLDTAKAWIDEGPYRAADAIARGLVDAAGYDDELPKLVAPKAARPPPLISSDDYLAVRRPARAGRRAHIGVIHVRGPIVSRAPFALGRVALEERIVGAVRQARENRATEGVVLFVDSPGGAVLASDRIYHEVVRLAEKKPVVAYFGNVAASGGYYIAAAAHRIVAQPTTVTGSIGVVAAHLVIGPLLDKLGIVTELVKRGARSDMMSTSRRLDDGERAAIDREIDGFYRDFVDIVARGRKRPVEEIEKLARGRVYSGRDALAHGLVDRLGGFDMALDDVREKLGDRRRRLEARSVRPPRTTPHPPELPVPFAEGLDAAIPGSPLAQMLVLALGITPNERVLAWSSWPVAGG